MRAFLLFLLLFPFFINDTQKVGTRTIISNNRKDPFITSRSIFFCSSIIKSFFCLSFQLRAPALREQVVQPVRQVEDCKDEREDEPGDDVYALGAGGEL